MFMKYIANPLMKLILRSPLHGLASGSLLLITVRGRKSGKRYTLPVNYAQSGEALYILAGAPQRKTWWRNLQPGAAVEITLRGERQAAFAEVLSGPADHQAIAEGLRLYFQHFPPSAKIHGVSRSAEGAFDPAELDRAASETILVRVRPSQTPSS